MNALDWLLVVLALLYALSGYWQGFIAGAMSTVGLLLGGLVGVWLAPQLLDDADPSTLVSLGALLVVILAASVGQAVFQQVGVRLRSQVTWQPARAVDAVGGAALSAAAVLVVAWALGAAVSGARLPFFSTQVRQSAVLGSVNAVMPSAARDALQAFNDVVASSSFFPRYLEPFADERIVEVRPPDRRVARDPEVAAAERSVLKIRGENRCGNGVEGTGFLYNPGRLMTNAHVVAGVRNPTVLVGDDEVPARVVLYDSDLDIAVLDIGDVGRPFLRFTFEAEPGDSTAVLGYPNDGPYTVRAARIRSEQRLRSPDIYGDGAVVREVFALRGTVQPGNSGGPLVSTDGRVAGVIFAASVSDRDTGYAITADQVRESAARGLQGSRQVSTGDCA